MLDTVIEGFVQNLLLNGQPEDDAMRICARKARDAQPYRANPKMVQAEREQTNKSAVFSQDKAGKAPILHEMPEPDQDPGGGQINFRRCPDRKVSPFRRKRAQSFGIIQPGCLQRIFGPAICHDMGSSPSR